METQNLKQLSYGLSSNKNLKCFRRGVEPPAGLMIYRVSLIENDYSKYKALIIKSIWGFQKNKETFDKFLEEVSKNKIPLYNPVEIISNNYNKEKQFKLLDSMIEIRMEQSGDFIVSNNSKCELSCWLELKGNEK